MKTLDLTREEIRNIIKTNEISNNSGLFGLCCNYDDNIALKFDLSVLNYKNEEVNLNGCYISQISVLQIDKLARLGDKLKLSTLPMGIAYCENIPVAVILKYFKNHRNLLSLPCELKDNLLKVLFGINDIIDELCQNYIYQLDIKESNFLYSRTCFVPQAIDLDGMLLNVGEHENVSQEEMIFEKLVYMFMHIIEEKMIVSGLSKEEVSKRMEEIKSYYFGINNYYGINAFLRSVKATNILQKIK